MFTPALRRTLALAGLVLGALPLHAQAQSAVAWCKDKPVKFASVTWESAQFFTEVARFVVEHGYGCKTELVTGSTAVTEAALVANDVQVWMEQWDRTDVIRKGKEAGKISLVGDLLKGGAVEGWFVPEYVVHGDAARNLKPVAPELKSVADLPKYTALFQDDEEPSKGRFLNCPTGWDCERINNQKLKAYKLATSYTNVRPGTGGTLDATISSAYERGRPLLFYYWSPAGLMGKYKLFQLAEPAYNETCWKTLQNSTTPDACGSATPTTKLQVGVSTPLSQAAPELVAFLSKIQVEPQALNAIIASMSARTVGGGVVAKEFLKGQADTWRAWVPAEVATRVAAKL